MWDMSAFVGFWPFRRLPDDTPEAMESRLRREGVEQAFVSPLDGLFAVDPQPANDHWSRTLSGSAFFRFVPVVNPTLPRWERSCRAMREKPAAVRLFPNYHGYRPNEESVGALMRVAEELKIPVFLQLRMQDARAVHLQAQVSDVDWQDALALATRYPQTPLIAVGPSWPEACKLRQAADSLPNLYLVLTHLELVDGLRRFVDQYGTERLLWGTHAPLFTPTAARYKLESARLDEKEGYAVRQGNAQRLFMESVPASA